MRGLKRARIDREKILHERANLRKSMRASMAALPGRITLAVFAVVMVLSVLLPAQADFRIVSSPGGVVALILRLLHP